jgi:hypothetical protein
VDLTEPAVVAPGEAFSTALERLARRAAWRLHHLVWGSGSGITRTIAMSLKIQVYSDYV